MARILLNILVIAMFRDTYPIEHSSEKPSAISKQESKSESLSDSELDLSLSDVKLPDSFLVSVIMESQPSNHPWADEVWDARGVVASSIDSATPDDLKREVKTVQQGDKKQLIYSGMKIRLYLDECESYYHNMMSPEPGCFIVARDEDDEGNETDMPIPALVTLSFDEAHSYLEGDDTVYAVPIPKELYLWAEAYVLENYVSEKRVKRKRVDWKKGDKRNSSSHAPAFDGPDGENSTSINSTGLDKGKSDA